MAKELTGSLVDYYLVTVAHPQRENQEPYQAECEDIILALGLTFDEGCIFKSIWRRARARQGETKQGLTNVYEAEKIHHYAKRVLKDAIYSEPVEATQLVLLDKHFPKDK